ncbi:MAG: PSD1 domain-containing protein [Bryobacterales bacterium]|nr:PSD1 domain-containing protein [Bryobacterales bacterium]
MTSPGWMRAVVGLLLAAGFTVASDDEAARKVLATRCWACHAQTAMGNLRLDSRDAMLRGGKSGPALVAGQPDESRILQATTRSTPGVIPMPPGAPLQPEEINILREWIAQGATWQEDTTHWSYRPISPPDPGQTIDRALLQAHKPKGITPNPVADRRTLLRRAAFDLTGLPPDEALFQQAMDDHRAGWFARYVDHLLASPHFGEKWARHWLDVARYGEDDFTGTEVVPYANAWRFRDWVVKAINNDLPYDRFLMAQLAGDLMNDESLLPATGLLGLGPWYYGIAQPPQSRADERNDRVDMVTRGMLGVTVACARCHDHKYDPFSAKEYYALAGVFASTAYREYPLVPEPEASAWQKQKEEADRAQKDLNKFLDAQGRKLADTYALRTADFLLAAAGKKKAGDLPAQLVERWKAYLAKPEDKHSFLARWFSGEQTAAEAKAFQKLLLEITAEKQQIEAANERLVEDAKRQAPRVLRTIVLPGGYRSEEDFNPGADIPAQSLDRDRFVAWNRIFGEKNAPLKFNHELTAALLGDAERAEFKRLKARQEALKAALPPKYPFLHGAAEFEPWDLQLHRRGNPEDLGEAVPRAFPAVLSDGRQIFFREGSGRMELARTVAHHPLASRVAVNRIWMALFGQGIVATPSNLGSVGDRPSVPGLLEYLAGRFVQKDYSVKTLVREILLSKAYQRDASAQPSAAAVDAANRTFWRQNRRRLEAEPLLDAMLAASGELDRTVGGESRPLEETFVRRTLYAKTSRFQQDETLTLFDLPSALVTCEQRVVTTVPLQKLFLLNSGTVHRRAEALAQRIQDDDPDAGITTAYRLLFQRPPATEELQQAREFLASGEPSRWREYAWALLSSNEFAYVD